MDPLMISVYIMHTPQSRTYITASTEQIYKLFNSSTVSLQVTQTVYYYVQTNL